MRWKGMRKKYVSQEEVNHKKFGAKWNLSKAKKFFKTVLGTDKFVEESPGGIAAAIFRFRNEFVWLEAYVGYGSTRIELRTVNPHETIGYYDFVTFEKDADYTWKQQDRSWEETKKEIIYDHKSWLHGLSGHNEKRFNEEIQKIKNNEF
jgi:hypothetical protein